jgi:anaerobic magnesium-protoporphyrin IX monomethyl ester cyclase
MVRELMPDDIGISVSYPLPGTKFHERVRSQMGEKRNWKDSDDLAMLYRGPFPEAFYRELYGAVHAEFRMRRAAERARRAKAGRVRALASIPKHWIAWQTQRRRMKRFHEIGSEKAPDAS